jgi:hypothetical protein
LIGLPTRLVLAVALSCAFGCSDDPVETPPTGDDTGTSSASDTGGTPKEDAGPSAAEDAAKSADTSMTAPEEMGSPACEVTVELKTGIAVATTQVAPISAGSAPVICWTVPDGEALPGEAGWLVRVEREENAGGTAEWLVDGGVPSSHRSIVYGECPDGVTTCGTANTLAAGSHFFSVWDDGDAMGLAGSTVVTVQ